MINLIVLIVIVFNLYLLSKIKKQARQIRILSTFIAGLSRYTTKSVASEDVLKAEHVLGNLEYSDLLNSVEKEFYEDFCIESYRKFLSKDRNLFYEEKMRNGGFNMMYWDFFDKQLKETSNEIKK